MAYLSNTLASLAPTARTIADDVLNPPANWIPKYANIPGYQDWLAAQGPNYRPRGDNTPEYEYANQFYQLPTNNGDFFTKWGVPLVTLGVGGAVAAAGGAAAGLGEGAVSGSAPLVGAGTTAPVGTALATPAQQAVIADLVATGLSEEAATAAVLSGGETLSGFGGATSGGSALSRLLGVGQTGQDVISLGGSIAPAVLGYFGADKQQDAYRDATNQFLNIGAPYRSTLEASYRPGFNLMDQPGYGDALNRSAEIATRAASAKYGNPGENPGAMADITNQVYAQTYLPALASYRGQLGQFGGLGLNTAGAGALGGAGVAGSEYDAIGVGLGRAMTPQLSLPELYRQYGLTVGGTRVNG